MLQETLNNAFRAADSAKGTGAIGVTLAAFSGLGVFFTNNLAWLLPLIPAVYVGAANMYYAGKLARYKAKIDLDAYRAKVSKETGLDIKTIDDL